MSQKRKQNNDDLNLIKNKKPTLTEPDKTRLYTTMQEIKDMNLEVKYLSFNDTFVFNTNDNKITFALNNFKDAIDDYYRKYHNPPKNQKYEYYLFDLFTGRCIPIRVDDPRIRALYIMYINNIPFDDIIKLIQRCLPNGKKTKIPGLEVSLDSQEFNFGNTTVNLPILNIKGAENFIDNDFFYLRGNIYSISNEIYYHLVSNNNICVFPTDLRSSNTYDEIRNFFKITANQVSVKKNLNYFDEQFKYLKFNIENNCKNKIVIIPVVVHVKINNVSAAHQITFIFNDKIKELLIIDPDGYMFYDKTFLNNPKSDIVRKDLSLQVNMLAEEFGKYINAKTILYPFDTCSKFGMQWLERDLKSKLDNFKGDKNDKKKLIQSKYLLQQYEVNKKVVDNCYLWNTIQVLFYLFNQQNFKQSQEFAQSFFIDKPEIAQAYLDRIIEIFKLA